MYAFKFNHLCKHNIIDINLFSNKIIIIFKIIMYILFIF